MKTNRMAAVGVIALSVGLLVGAGNGYAADFVWTNTSASGCWQTPTSWTTNGGGMGSWPGSNDNAWFTNAATYSVTLSNDVLNIQSNFFSNAAYTTATVTLNLGAYELNPVYTGNIPGAFLVGDGANSTTIVYLASSTVSGKGLVVPGRIVVGRNGIGILFVTNGNVLVNSTVLANGTGGRGTLVLSGTNTVWINTSTCAIGNFSNSFGSSLVISNFASMTVTSSFRLGSSSGQGGCSDNTLVLDTNGRLFTHTGPVTIGHRSSAAEPSYNNTATVQGGAVWDNGNASFVIGSADGGAATGNVLRIMAGSFVTNISYLTITATNTLDLQGGWIDTSATTNSGTIQGCGTITGNVVVDAGGTVLADCGTTLNFSGTVTNNGTVVAANGTFIDFYGPVVNNGLINGTNGYVQFFSTFENNGTLLSNGSTGTVNSWTSDVSGSWFASSNWSLGAIPTNTHSVLISNGLTKTVMFSGIGGPETISNLLVSAPVGDTNTLLLLLSGPGFRALTVLNSLTISTGGVLTVVSSGPNITNHQFTVSGVSDGAFTIDGQSVLGGITIATNVPTYVGYLGNGTLRINGKMFCGRNAYVGFSPGSSGELTIAGGTNTLSANLVVGCLADATGAVWVTGGQLTVTNATTYVGSNGVGQITVSNGTLLACDVLVGTSSGSEGALTAVGGDLTAVNAGNTGLIDVRRGSLTINGGAVTVDQLVLFSANGAISFNGGTLNSGGTFVTNGQTFAVGNGSTPATFHLADGVHSFGYNLLIRTNAFLTGCGTITGNVLVEGAVLADCGTTIDFDDIVTNDGTVTATSGTVLRFHGPVVNNGFIDATGGNVQFLSTITDNGTVLTPTNSWTDATGKWETSGNWSQGVAPTNTQAANLITNAGNNTVTIDATTSSGFPGTMTIRNLNIAGAGSSTNTLALSNAGLVTPLHVLNDLNLSNDSAVVINNSALQVDGGLLVGWSVGSGNQLIITNAGQLVSALATVGGVSGFDNTVLVTGSNSLWFSDGTIQIGNGGTNDSLTIDDGGAVIASNASHTAQVLVDGATIFLGVGTFKPDNLVVTNGGAVQYTQAYQVENASVTIASGSVEANSNFVVAGTAGSTGTVAVTGGELVVTNGVLSIGNDGTVTSGGGVGSMTVSNAPVLASTVLLGSTAGGQGSLTIQSGGVLSFPGSNALLSVNALTVQGGADPVGVLDMYNGTIVVGVVANGTMTLDGGIVNCDNVTIGESALGTCRMKAGTITMSSKLLVGDGAGSTGMIWMDGGTWQSASLSTIGNNGVGQMTISNGLVTLPRVVVSGIGTSQNPGTLTVAGGSLLSTNMIVGFAANSTGTVWITGGELDVTNGSGAARLIIGQAGAGGGGQGTVVLNSGTLVVDQLLVTNSTKSLFSFVGGTLKTGHTLVTNDAEFVVGDGTSPATLDLLGGFHSFANGLKISHHATLAGSGTVSNSVVNFGILYPDGGPLIFTGPVTNNGLIVTNSPNQFPGGLVNNDTVLDAVKDADGDGMNNLSEVLAGTDPLNSASVFRILAIAREGNNLRVTWSTVGGKRYVVQTSSGTSGNYANNFTDLTSSVISMPGTIESTTSYLDLGAATNFPARYYRVRLAP